MEFDAAIEHAETLAALRWTEPVEKDLPIPRENFTSGWNFNIYNGTVQQMWSSVVFHGYGAEPKQECSSSQRGISLFSTKILALKALRHATECEAAEKLRRIDAAIAEEMSSNARNEAPAAPLAAGRLD